MSHGMGNAPSRNNEQSTAARVVPPVREMFMPRAAREQLENCLSGIDFAIDKTWDGLPVTEHEPFTVHMEWYFQKIRGKPHKRVVKVMAQGPLFDDPPEPDDQAGYCANLWDYECLEFFFANDKDQYLEVEVGPHGHWLVYLHDGIRKPFNKGEELLIDIQNTFEGNTWRTYVEIPLAFFPAKVTKFNAYALHGSGDDRHYEAHTAVTDGTETEPDFHRLQYFPRIDTKRIIPAGQNDTAFKDHVYGDLWHPNEDLPPAVEAMLKAGDGDYYGDA